MRISKQSDEPEGQVLKCILATIHVAVVLSALLQGLDALFVLLRLLGL